MEARSLTRIAEEQLATARESSAGRSAITLFGGQHHDMRQTLIALRAGSALHEHDSPGEATLQVLLGEVRLSASGAGTWQGATGDHLAIPPQRHSVEALSDAVILLTVATRA